MDALEPLPDYIQPVVEASAADDNESTRIRPDIARPVDELGLLLEDLMPTVKKRK
jgi:hypothetical protein